MRKMIWCGMLGAMISAALCYLATGTLSRHGKPGTGADCQLRGFGSNCPADESHLLDALLPDPAKLLADWQAFETIDLLSPQSSWSRTKPDDTAKQSPLGLSSESFLPPDLVPAERIRSAEESECFPLMPYSERTTQAVFTPRLELAAYLSEASDHAEEQEAESSELPADPKVVEERLKRSLQSYLEKGTLNGKAEVDTMEFRPSDAKKGEFKRIPF